MSLVIYRWEREKFPWHYRVNILPQYRAEVTRELALAFGLKHVYVQLTTRGGGWANTGNGQIRLPSRAVRRCSLAMIVHEIAHHYDKKHYGGNGHRASFKKSLIKLLVEVRTYRMLIPVFAKIRRDAVDRAAANAKATVAYSKKLQREADFAARKKTTAYKLEKVQARAAILRTRIKRLTTALKKAERQAKALERRAVSKEKLAQCAPAASRTQGECVAESVS